RAAVSDSDADGRQYARRRGRVERGAGADGSRGPCDLRRDRRAACDGRVAGCRGGDRPSGGADRLRHANARRVPAAAQNNGVRPRCESFAGSDPVTRLEATRVVVDAAGGAPIIASLGHPAYDLFVAGDRPQNFYTWGSMGIASSIGLGLALARPDIRVFVVDGDGSLLMNLGSLATIGLLQPKNLVLVVMDNALFATTGW